MSAGPSDNIEAPTIDEVDRFVVGTGRCGSTLLTKMLDSHRSACGLNEVFTGLDWGRRFTDQQVDGAWVADLLGTPNHVIDMVLGKGYDAEEVTYPFRPTDRYRRGDPMPWILTSCLGHLTDDPDGLWDRLGAELSRRSIGPLRQHYRAFFAALAEPTGATAWIERSGSSVEYLDGILSVFGEARVVHLVRSGPEVALSMRNHPFYRLAVQLYYGVMPEGVDPEDSDGIVDGWLEGNPAVELYGRYWSDQLIKGAEPLARLGDERLLTVSFEELVVDPMKHTERLAAFFELPSDPGFSERASAMVRGVPPSRVDELGSDDRTALLAACEPGQAVLAAFGR